MGLGPGLGKIGWHRLRHTYRSWLDQTKAPNGWSGSVRHFLQQRYRGGLKIQPRALARQLESCAATDIPINGAVSVAVIDCYSIQTSSLIHGQSLSYQQLRRMCFLTFSSLMESTQTVVTAVTYELVLKWYTMSNTISSQLKPAVCERVHTIFSLFRGICG